MMKALFGRQHNMLSVLFSILTLSIFLAACGAGGGGTPSTDTGNTGNTGGAPVNGKDCKKVSVLLPETASSERWEGKDHPLLDAALKKELPDATVNIVNAQGSAQTQQNQADQALTSGACILVVAPVDADAAAAIVASAKKQNVPVIAYDRLIQSNDLKFYVSFDNVKVGELQGQYVVDNYEKFAKNGVANIAMLNGSKTDNNALLFNQGAMSKIQPLIDSGKLKKVYDIFVPDWNNDRARTSMDQALTANQNNIQIAYVANDGMANSVIASLRAQKLNGKVLVTGQDATAAGIQNILTGNQGMTVYKAITKEAEATAQLVAALSKGTDTATLTAGNTVKTKGGADIPSVLETPVSVDKTNIKDTVLADNYVTKDDICKNLPAGTDTGGIC